MKYTIKNDLLPIVKTGRRQGFKNLGVKFGTLHDTGNPDSTAQGNVNYYKNSSSVLASAHVFIDDKDIIICIPLNEKAWHVLYNVTTDNAIYGDDANDISIGIELSYFPNDKKRTEEAYKKYVWFSAWLANNYKFNPRNFIGHNKLDPKRKVDPMNALNILGKSYNQLLEDIVKEYEECNKVVSVASDTPPILKPIIEPVVKPIIKPIEKDVVKMEQELYKPSNKAVLDATALLLRRLEEKEDKALDPKWRLQLLNGTLTMNDYLGIMTVAYIRGLFQGEVK